MRLFGRRKVGVTPIPAPHTNTDWDTTIDALSFTINSHTTQVSVPREKIEAIKSLSFEQWLQSRREATAREVLSMAAKLLNLTYVVRAGKYFVWRLLWLIGLHNSGGSKNQNRTVGHGRDFHAALPLWKWAIVHERLHQGEALSAPCYTAIHDPQTGTTCPTPVSRRCAVFMSRGRYVGDTTCQKNWLQSEREKTIGE